MNQGNEVSKTEHICSDDTRETKKKELVNINPQIV